MARRFRGDDNNKVDGKGRVSVPALFRRVLQACDPNWTEGLNPELVIVYGNPRNKFMECYTIEAIEEVDAKIDAMPRGSKERRILQQIFHGQSFPTSVDETGRLLLPAKLRKMFGITEYAYFFGAGDTFQIWNPETYDQEAAAEVEEYIDALPEDVDPLSLLDTPYAELVKGA